MVPGGVMQELHPDFQKKVKEFIKLFKSKVHEYDELRDRQYHFSKPDERCWYFIKGRCDLFWLYRSNRQRQRRELRYQKIISI